MNTICNCCLEILDGATSFSDAFSFTMVCLTGTISWDGVDGLAGIVEGLTGALDGFVVLLTV